MGNEIENFSKENEGKAICHSYPSFVDELASRMMVNERVLLTNKKDKFDPEDMFSWIRAVDYKDTQHAPDVQAILSTKQGKETIVLDVRKETTINSKEDKVTQESLLYSMALTEAKMKMISLQAEEVYPAVAFQIKDYRKAMEKMREEVLENKSEKRSLEDVLSSLSDGKLLPYATALALGVLFLASCGRNPETTKTITPAPTESPVVEVTEMPTETATVTATMEPTPTATATEKVEGSLVEWDKIELNVGGRSMEFVMGTEKGADLKNKWGISKMEINDNLIDAETRLSSMVGASFWQIYMAQSGEKISYEEYLLAPEKYKINLVTPDGEGGYKSTLFSLDQIKRFERRFVGKDDPRLFYNDPSTKTDAVSGYEFEENGTFILYESVVDRYVQILEILSPSSLERLSGSSMEYFVGNNVGDSIKQELYGVANTPELESPNGLGYHEYSWYDFMFAIDDYAKMTSYEGLTSSVSNRDVYFTKNSFWRVEFSQMYKTTVK